MKDANIRNKELVEFWRFWLWQYISRNSDYKKAYHHYVNAKIPE